MGSRHPVAGAAVRSRGTGLARLGARRTPRSAIASVRRFGSRPVRFSRRRAPPLAGGRPTRSRILGAFVGSASVVSPTSARDAMRAPPLARARGGRVSDHRPRPRRSCVGARSGATGRRSRAEALPRPLLAGSSPRSGPAREGDGHLTRRAPPVSAAARAPRARARPARGAWRRSSAAHARVLDALVRRTASVFPREHSARRRDSGPSGPGPLPRGCARADARRLFALPSFLSEIAARGENGARVGGSEATRVEEGGSNAERVEAVREPRVARCRRARVGERSEARSTTRRRRLAPLVRVTRKRRRARAGRECVPFPEGPVASAIRSFARSPATARPPTQLGFIASLACDPAEDVAEFSSSKPTSRPPRGGAATEKEAATNSRSASRRPGRRTLAIDGYRTGRPRRPDDSAPSESRTNGSRRVRRRRGGDIVLPPPSSDAAYRTEPLHRQRGKRVAPRPRPPAARRPAGGRRRRARSTRPPAGARASRRLEADAPRRRKS